VENLLAIDHEADSRCGVTTPASSRMLRQPP
jgi:hypothetical protein